MKYLIHYFPRLMQFKRVELGSGYILSYALFEWKLLFSVIIYNWKTIRQNRFHSHAFPAIAFLLKGEYVEEVYKDGKIITKVVGKDQRFKPRYLPRHYTHRILKAKPQTYTIVFTGPWTRYWYEWFEDTNTWVKYTWGRRVVSKSSTPPKRL